MEGGKHQKVGEVRALLINTAIGRCSCLAACGWSAQIRETVLGIAGCNWCSGGGGAGIYARRMFQALSQRIPIPPPAPTSAQGSPSPLPFLQHPVYRHARHRGRTQVCSARCAYAHRVPAKGAGLPLYTANVQTEWIYPLHCNSLSFCPQGLLLCTLCGVLRGENSYGGDTQDCTETETKKHRIFLSLYK